MLREIDLLIRFSLPYSALKFIKRQCVFLHCRTILSDLTTIVEKSSLLFGSNFNIYVHQDIYIYLIIFEYFVCDNKVGQSEYMKMIFCCWRKND